MSENILRDIFLLLGTFFVLVAAIGIVRFPDLFTRMQAVTKSSTLGLACLLIAIMCHTDFSLGAVFRCLAIIVFLFLTAPVGAHMIARIAYRNKTPMWKGTIIDELKGKYDLQNNRLNGIEENDENRNQ